MVISNITQFGNIIIIIPGWFLKYITSGFLPLIQMYRNGWWAPKIDAEMGPVLSWSYPGRDVGKGSKGPEEQVSSYPRQKGLGAPLQEKLLVTIIIVCSLQFNSLLSCFPGFLNASSGIKNGCRRQSSWWWWDNCILSIYTIKVLLQGSVWERS